MLWLMSMLGIFGAGLFYGDAVITPAMSVLSAVEGLEVATPMFKPYVVPITIGVLCGLFIFPAARHGQRRRLFGPVMLFWFGTLGVLGLWNILKHPDVIAAINPWYAACTSSSRTAATPGSPWAPWCWPSPAAKRCMPTWATSAGADQMGLAGYVFPCLYLNYLGQGALILDNPAAVKNPFFMLVPDELLYPMVALATAPR
jgi:KUP system potassium uptake protein